MRSFAPPVYRVTEHTVNELAMMAPNETCDDVVPDSATTSANAPCPVLRSSASPVPDSVAVLPPRLRSGHVPLAMSNAPQEYHALMPVG